jgi:hypothetical protein
LTPFSFVVIVSNMPNKKASLAFPVKHVLFRYGAAKITVWKVPVPVLGSAHCYKYSLVYHQPNAENPDLRHRVVCFDNERGKGDHYHILENSFPYRFTSLEKLILDFYSKVIDQEAAAERNAS